MAGRESMALEKTDGVTRRTSPVLIAAAWAVVVLPAVWGLEHTVENALKIFAKPVAAGGAMSSSPAGSGSARAPALTPAK